MKEIDLSTCLQLLKEEIVPALGCTEPGAVALAAACANEALGCSFEHMDIQVSGNMLKNVKSVSIPNTGGLKGVAAAALCGIAGGSAKNKLEVLSTLTEEVAERVRSMLAQKERYTLTLSDTIEPLYIKVRLTSGSDWAEAEIQKSHININRVLRNGKDLTREFYQRECMGGSRKTTDDVKMLDIYEFSQAVPLEELIPILEPQIRCNMKIAEEGIKEKCGASVGRHLLNLCHGNRYAVLAGYAAAGSDARMSGCSLPVVVNSGSGNQGITVSVPVIIYAKEIGSSEDALYRALAFANLVSIRLKSGIGKLSAYCGAVSAGCAAACGIAYLDYASFSVIEDTITNTLAAVSGVICDGAKPSCAAKIAAGVQAGMLGYEMAKDGCRFREGEGIVGKDLETTIAYVSRVGREGMRDTDKKILEIMMTQ